MTTKRVSIEVDGKVTLSADVTKARQEIAGLASGHTIGSGTPPAGGTATPHTIGAGTPMNTPNTEGQRQWMDNTAWRMMQGAINSMSTTRTESEYRRLSDRIERASGYAQGAGNDALVESLNKLRETMDRQRAAQDAARNTPPPPGHPPGPPPPNNWLQNAGNWLGHQGGNSMLGHAGRWLGGPNATALLGGGIGRLAMGPLGMALGAAHAANFAFNTISNHVTEANAPARNELVGYADLARQYGSSRDLLKNFRDPNGWTNPAFAQMGYTATQAAHVAALYDRPGGMMNDTTRILQFARTTGVDESRSASLAAQFGRAGVGGLRGGSAEDSLRTLKLAMTEGVKAGISQSETMNAMSSAVQRNTSSGQFTNHTSMAFFSSILRHVNDARNTNPMMRGEQGLNAVQGLMRGMGDGGGDTGMQMLLTRGVLDKGLPSATAAGMVTEDGRHSQEGQYYELLRKESPVMAAQYLMKRAGSGKNPQIMKLMAETIDQASGGSVAMKTMMYKALNPEMSDEQIASFIGGGGMTEFMTGAANSGSIQRAKEGQNLRTDPQGKNFIANQTMFLRVAEQDRELLKSLASLNLSAGLEGVLSDFKNYFADLRGNLSRSVGGDFAQDGNLTGQAGAGWKNPSSYKPRPGSLVPNSAPSADSTTDLAPPPARGGSAGGPEGTASATRRMLGSIARVESRNGEDPSMNSPGKSAVGLFQMQSKWLVGPNGWAAEAKVKMTNPDGSPVTTPDQARAWQLANPTEANKIAVSRLQNAEDMIRAKAAKDGITLSDADVTGMVGVIWHDNGADSLRAVTDPKTGKLMSPQQMARSTRKVGTITDGTYFNRAAGYHNSAETRPANTGIVDATRLAPKGEQVVFTQGFGDNKNNTELGYGKDGHMGWDFRIGERGVGGEAVHSRTDGEVVQAGKNGSYGNTVIVQRSDGYRVLHGHLDKVSAKVGQNVTTASVIGTEGATGGPKGMSPHLHVEVWDRRGRPVNPAVIFGNRNMKVGQQVKGFSSGGYTGDGGRHEVAGAVHGQEFVLNADATRKYRPMLEQMNSGSSLGVSVDVGGTLRIEGSLSAAAHAAIQDRASAFRGDVAHVVRRDLTSHKGVR